MSTASRTASQPPKEEWPTFILDLGEKIDENKWTIRYFAKVDAQDINLPVDSPNRFWDDKLLAWRFSAISYAWGNWADWVNLVDPSLPENAQYPKFELDGLKWVFPKLKADPKTNKVPFEIQDIHNVFKKLGTRYIWWDWACNAQGDNAIMSQALPKAMPAVSGDPKTLLQLQALEVDKMKTVYAKSLNGCLWMHQTTWNTTGTGTKSPLQEALEIQAKIVNTANRDFTLELVKEYVDKLTAMLSDPDRKQLSIGSVWSFQEGIMFSHSSRAQKWLEDPKAAPVATCLILDHEGKAFTNTITGNPADYIQDIVATATTMVAIIASALELRAKGIPLNASASPFLRWCYEPANEKDARALMSQYMASGSVGYIFDNPMSLLESKFARGTTSTNTEADRTVRAMIGAMNIDFPGDKLVAARDAKELAIKAIDPTTIQKEPKESDASALRRTQKSVGDRAECAIIKTPYLEALIAHFQWRFLLHARGNDDTLTAQASQQTTGVKSWWTQFVNIASPAFASLDAYIGATSLFYLDLTTDLAKDLMKTYEYKGLPKLALSTQKPAQPLVASKTVDTYKFYDLSTASSGWSDCTFYNFISRDFNVTPLAVPGTVGFSKVNFADRAKTLGSSIILLPFEKLKVAEKPPAVVNAPKPIATLINSVASALDTIMGNKQPIRCFIFSNYDAKTNAATYRGVGDFVGLSDSNLVTFTKDLEIW